MAWADTMTSHDKLTSNQAEWVELIHRRALSNCPNQVQCSMHTRHTAPSCKPQQTSWPQQPCKTVISSVFTLPKRKRETSAVQDACYIIPHDLSTKKELHETRRTPAWKNCAVMQWTQLAQSKQRQEIKRRELINFGSCPYTVTPKLYVLTAKPLHNGYTLIVLVMIPLFF